MLHKQCIQQPDKILLLFYLESSAMKPVKDYTTLYLKIQNKWLYSWEINHFFLKNHSLLKNLYINMYHLRSLYVVIVWFAKQFI